MLTFYSCQLRMKILISIGFLFLSVLVVLYTGSLGSLGRHTTNSSLQNVKIVDMRAQTCGNEQYKYMLTNRDDNWVNIYRDRFNQMTSTFNQAVTEKGSTKKLAQITEFHPLITVNEYIEYVTTLFTLTDTLQANKITYFLDAGSALGVYRHNGWIPWDDDVDILISLHDNNNKSRKILSSIPGYRMREENHIQWKFYGLTAKNYSKKYPNIFWPFIGIHFFEEKRNRIYHMWPHPHVRQRIGRTKDVFPLQYRPFEGGMLPVPCALASRLNREYTDTQRCMTTVYDHKASKGRPIDESTTIDCSLLYGVYPFTFREKHHVAGCVIETLQIGECVLSTHVLPDFCDSKIDQSVKP